MSLCSVCKKREGKERSFDLDLPIVIVCDLCLYKYDVIWKREVKR